MFSGDKKNQAAPAARSSVRRGENSCPRMINATQIKCQLAAAGNSSPELICRIRTVGKGKQQFVEKKGKKARSLKKHAVEDFHVLKN